MLSGRDEQLDQVGQRLTGLEAGRMPSQDFLFYGPRGNGKTALLLEIGDRARKRGLRVERLPVDALTDRENLARELQERSGRIRDRLTGIQFAGVGATAQPAAATRNVEALFAGWLSADGSRPLVVLLDEVQALVPDVARPFLDAIQTAKADRGAPPFLIIAAGTPDAPRRILEAGTHNERGFLQLPIGRLSRRAAEEALSVPARVSGLPMEDEALTLLSRVCRDYAYFLQLFGRAAWEQAAQGQAGAVTVESARRGIEAAAPTVARFYARRFDEARRRGVHRTLAPLASLVLRSGGAIRDRELEDLLQRQTASAGGDGEWIRLLDTLRDLGVIRENDSGRWEFGIPSFADYVIQRTA